MISALYTGDGNNTVTGIIAGSVVVSSAVVLILVITVCVCQKKKRKKRVCNIHVHGKYLGY